MQYGQEFDLPPRGEVRVPKNDGWLESLENGMRARRKDSNHVSVGDYLRALGWSVLDLAQYGVSVDYAVSKPGYAALVEVKDGTLPPSARKLTLKEIQVRANWQGDYVIATSPEDAAGQLLQLWRGWKQ